MVEIGGSRADSGSGESAVDDELLGREVRDPRALAELVSHCGEHEMIDSEAAFSRAFKRLQGMPPSALRRATPDSVPAMSAHILTTDAV